MTLVLESNEIRFMVIRESSAPSSAYQTLIHDRELIAPNKLALLNIHECAAKLPEEVSQSRSEALVNQASLLCTLAVGEIITELSTRKTLSCIGLPPQCTGQSCTQMSPRTSRTSHKRIQYPCTFTYFIQVALSSEHLS